MCLYPRLIHNPKYKANKKNGGQVPPIIDQRVLKVPIGCGTCIECRKQKAREWQSRLQEDIKTYTNGKFVTLTFSTESLKKLIQDHTEEATEARKRPKRHRKGKPEHKELPKDKPKVYLDKLKGYDLDNAIVTRAVRLFLERWRKKYKKSLRHWLITELGHGKTEHIHLHGIIWTDDTKELDGIWQYGNVWKGYENTSNTLQNYVNARTVNYIIKYVTKVDEQHKTYKPIILTSAGIGNHYTTIGNYITNEYKGIRTDERYRTATGHKTSLPIYWRNKIYTEEQRERLWLQKLDKEERWICGEKISIKEGEEVYYEVLEYHRKRTRNLGYDTPEFIWSRKQYEMERRELIHKKRLGGSDGGPLPKSPRSR